MPIPQPLQPQVDEAKRKISGILEELESSTDTEVQRIALEDVVDTDPASGRPAVKQSVEITVTPKPRRKWLR